MPKDFEFNKIGGYDKGRSAENVKPWIEDKSRLTNMEEPLVLDLGCGTGIYISALKFSHGSRMRIGSSFRDAQAGIWKI